MQHRQLGRSEIVTPRVVFGDMVVTVNAEHTRGRRIARRDDLGELAGR